VIRLRVRLGFTEIFADPHTAIEGVEHPGILSRRLQTGRHPLHRFGLGDHLIDVIAVDALKRAQLGSDARGLDTRQAPDILDRCGTESLCGLNPARLPVTA
jgi:hypothetical protein